MIFVGIDIGSRAIKLAVLQNGQLIDYKVIESAFEPHKQAEELIKQYPSSTVVATGYGRHLAKKFFADDVITEIKAHALGVRYYFSEGDTVLDVGGQDSKVITLDSTGKVINFIMNDKCAAGTGRFLEIMSASLGFSLDEFADSALRAQGEVKINSMCTVFAESEVISLKNQGIAPEDIAKALHIAVADRLIAMLHRIGRFENIVFSGGVAKNKCIVNLLQQGLGKKLLIAPVPEIIGAIGAALYAGQKALSFES